MEGSDFETTRGPARPGPSFEPPADPAGGPSLRGLALIAQIMRGRELAADAAGLPPLDSDQVLDLQRSAGNRLTGGALERWTVPVVAVLELHVSCTAGERRRYRIAIADTVLEATLGAGDTTAMTVAPGAEQALALRIAAPDGTTAHAELPLPFLVPVAIAVGDARFVVSS